jgi:hypothetical protein
MEPARNLAISFRSETASHLFQIYCGSPNFDSQLVKPGNLDLAIAELRSAIARDSQFALGHKSLPPSLVMSPFDEPDCSRQHEVHLDSGLELHRAAVLHKRFETPLANRIRCCGCQRRVAANHGKMLHRAIPAHVGFQDDRTLNVLLPCQLWILWFNPLE